MFKENDIDLCFTCLEMTGQDKSSASDPESLVLDVLQVAQKHKLNFEGENAIERYDWSAYNQVINWVTKGLKEFTFLRMTDKLMENEKIWYDFKKFTKKIHSVCLENDEKENI